ncbi:MAG: prepilin-type N-terminal cleavage/methylation domain-containing protein [Planctomycetes bacterium]|nr:prepilin-type N-terminal cleavage/methylation domain-containing protein [Planctomycetota bacterium]
MAVTALPDPGRARRVRSAQTELTMKRSPHGFTLVELMVVVAIILALLAILLPAMGRAREAANRATCASRLHQLGVGSLVFAGDRFGRLPDLGPGTASVSQGNHPVIFMWSIPDTDILLGGYLGNDYRLMQCPTYDAAFDLAHHLSGNPDAHGFNYRYAGFITTLTYRCQPAYPNGTIDLNGDGMGERLRALTLHDQLVVEPMLFGDIVTEFTPGIYSWNGMPVSHAAGSSAKPAGGNNLWRDGHVAWTDFDQMTANYSHASPPGVGTGLRDMFWRLTP